MNSPEVQPGMSLAEAAGKTGKQVMTRVAEGGKSLESIISEAEVQVAALKRMTELALRVTNFNDWTDQNGKPYLEYTGSRKVAKVFGLSIKNVMMDKMEFEDEKGAKHMVFTFTGDSEWNGESVPEMGTCSSKDRFFAERTNKSTGEKYYLPLSEIDITNLIKKGHTNFMNRAIKARLGLSFTWEEIEEVTQGRITRQLVTGVSYKQGTRGGSTDKARTVAQQDQYKQVWEWILEYAGGNVDSAKQILSNLTAFKDFPGHTEINKVSATQMKYLYPRVKKEVEGLRAQQQQNPPPPTDDEEQAQREGA